MQIPPVWCQRSQRSSKQSETAGKNLMNASYYPLVLYSPNYMSLKKLQNLTSMTCDLDLNLTLQRDALFTCCITELTFIVVKWPFCLYIVFKLINKYDLRDLDLYDIWKLNWLCPSLGPNECIDQITGSSESSLCDFFVHKPYDLLTFDLDIHGDLADLCFTLECIILSSCILFTKLYVFEKIAKFDL